MYVFLKKRCKNTFINKKERKKEKKKKRKKERKKEKVKKIEIVSHRSILLWCASNIQRGFFA